MKTQPVETLGEWLNIATRRLSHESQQRVRDEIVAHFELARDDAINNGVPHDEASRTALHSLGDAKTANRSYRKVLLTQREEAILEKLRSAYAVSTLLSEDDSASSRLFRRFSLTAVILMAAAFAIEPGRDSAAMLFMAAGTVFMAEACRSWKPTRASGRVFRVICRGWFSISVWLTWGPGGVLPFGSLEKVLVLGLLTLPLLTWMEIPRTALRRKLPITDWPKNLYF